MESLTICCFGDNPIEELEDTEVSLAFAAYLVLHGRIEDVKFLFEFRSYYDFFAARVIREEIKKAKRGRMIAVLPYEIPYLTQNPVVYRRYFDELEYCTLAAQAERVDRAIRRYMVTMSDVVFAYSLDDDGEIQECANYAHDKKKAVFYI